jgi:hypothetical protein
MQVTLPNGLIDGVDLFNIAEIDELRGKQQNYLMNKDLVVGNIGHIPKILTDVVLSLQTKEGLVWKGKMEEAIYKLPSGDLETLLIKIRENTYGPRFYHEATCTHCQTVNKNLRLNLDTLKIEPMSMEEMFAPKVAILPKSGQEVEFKPIYLKDLFDIIKITSSKYDVMLTSMTSVAVKRLGIKSPVVPADLEKLPAMDNNFIQEKVGELKLEGTIDSMIQIDCKNCGKEFETKLNVLNPDFFYPSKGSSNLNT